MNCSTWTNRAIVGPHCRPPFANRFEETGAEKKIGFESESVNSRGRGKRRGRDMVRVTFPLSKRIILSVRSVIYGIFIYILYAT